MIFYYFFTTKQSDIMYGYYDDLIRPISNLNELWGYHIKSRNNDYFLNIAKRLA